MSRGCLDNGYHTIDREKVNSVCEGLFCLLGKLERLTSPTPIKWQYKGNELLEEEPHFPVKRDNSSSTVVVI